MKWLDTTADQGSAAHSAAFWEEHRVALQDGSFWVDRITRYRDQPIERLKLAITNLPLPAAFREAAITIRALARARMRQKEDFTDELVLIYWLAAIESFGVPYSKFLGQSGFNVLQSIPGQVIQTLPFTYAQIGYRHLGLLNKTDIKWCTDRWGEPLRIRHSTTCTQTSGTSTKSKNGVGKLADAQSYGRAETSPRSRWASDHDPRLRPRKFLRCVSTGSGLS